ncbi:hypothetical protein LMG24235_07886 [Paraburkholderia sabiae]|nr:hypothetical protein LMG24235_07886 [Paraburkholderia sabiae]
MRLSLFPTGLKIEAVQKHRLERIPMARSISL